MPFDLLSLPFCWPTFSHWTTNSANCGRVSPTIEKQGTAALSASQKPAICGDSRFRHRTLEILCAPRGQNERVYGKSRGVGVFVSLLTACGATRGTHTLLDHSAPLIWNTSLCCVDHSGFRGNLQRS